MWKLRHRNVSLTKVTQLSVELVFKHRESGLRVCALYYAQSVHSVVSDSVTPWTAAHQAFLSVTNSWSLLRLVSIKLVMPYNHLILCRPLLLPSIFPSIRVFSNELALCIRWPKSWSFSVTPSNEYSVWISFRIDWFDLLAEKETLKNIFLYHSVVMLPIHSILLCYS